MKGQTVKVIAQITTAGITCGILGYYLGPAYLENVVNGSPFTSTLSQILLTIFGGVCVLAVSFILGTLASDATEKLSFFLFRRFETTIIEQGRKDWFDWFTRHNELSTNGQIQLVEQAGTDEKHLNMLMGYTDELCPEAATLFVNTLFNHIEDYLVNGYYQGNILSILVNGLMENPKYSKILKNYVKRNDWGYVYLSHENFIEKLIENGETEILIGFCKKEKYMKPEDEVRLVKRASKEQSFKDVLIEYLNAIKNSDYRYYRTENSVGCSSKCGMWKDSISENAEKEIVENSPYDIIKIYCKYAENLRYTVQSILAKRYQKDKDEEIRGILLRQKLLCNDALSIIINDN